MTTGLEIVGNLDVSLLYPGPFQGTEKRVANTEFDRRLRIAAEQAKENIFVEAKNLAREFGPVGLTDGPLQTSGSTEERVVRIIDLGEVAFNPDFVREFQSVFPRDLQIKTGKVFVGEPALVGRVMTVDLGPSEHHRAFIGAAKNGCHVIGQLQEPVVAALTAFETRPEDEAQLQGSALLAEFRERNLKAALELNTAVARFPEIRNQWGLNEHETCFLLRQTLGLREQYLRWSGMMGIDDSKFQLIQLQNEQNLVSNNGQNL